MWEFYDKDIYDILIFILFWGFFSLTCWYSREKQVLIYLCVNLKLQNLCPALQFPIQWQTLLLRVLQRRWLPLSLYFLIIAFFPMMEFSFNINAILCKLIGFLLLAVLLPFDILADSAKLNSLSWVVTPLTLLTVRYHQFYLKLFKVILWGCIYNAKVCPIVHIMCFLFMMHYDTIHYDICHRIDVA